MPWVKKIVPSSCAFEIEIIILNMHFFPFNDFVLCRLLETGIVSLPKILASLRRVICESSFCQSILFKIMSDIFTTRFGHLTTGQLVYRKNT